MDIISLVALAEKLIPVANKLYKDVMQAINDSKDLSPEDKDKLIARIKAAQEKVVSWEEL